MKSTNQAMTFNQLHALIGVAISKGCGDLPIYVNRSNEFLPMLASDLSVEDTDYITNADAGEDDVVEGVVTITSWQ